MRTRTGRAPLDSAVLRKGSVDLAVDIGAAAFWQLRTDGRVLLDVPTTRSLRKTMFEVHLRRPGEAPGLAGDLLRSLEGKGTTSMIQLLGHWKRGQGRGAMPVALTRRCVDELEARGAVVKHGPQLTAATVDFASLRDAARAASVQWRQFQADPTEVVTAIRRNCELAIRATEGGE